MQMLTNLLAEIKTNPKDSHVKEVVNRLRNKDLETIYFEVYDTAITKKLSKLIIYIFCASIRLLLENWKGYYKEKDRKDMLKDLLEFLKENLDYVEETASEKVAECAKVSTTPERANANATLEKENSSTTPERVNASTTRKEVNASTTSQRVNASITPERVNVSTTLEKENASTTPEKVNASTTPEKVNANATPEDVIKLVCPYNKLKSVFYSKVHPTENSLINYCNHVPHMHLKTYSYNYKMSELVNWPCIEIKLQLSNFAISRQNMNKTEFKLVSLSPSFKLKIKAESKKLKYQENQDCRKVSFPGEFILAFLKQLKCELSAHAYTSSLKKSVLCILSAFEKDISLCTEEIDTTTEYYYSLSRYPYVRFLAQASGVNHSRPLIKHQDQMSLDENSQNIRLQQIFNPYVKFVISAFNVTYDLDENQGYVFSISQDLIHGLFHLISFKCCLCNFQCYGVNSKEMLKNHLNLVHSVEPDWCCPLCKKNFTMQYLTAYQWQHHCKNTSNENE